MAQITITIPDNKLAEILDTFADRYGWTDQLGVTKGQFAKQKLIDFIRREYREHKINSYLASITDDLNDLS